MGLVDAATLAEPSLNAAGKAQGKREKQAETGLGSSPLNSFFEDKASIQMTMKEENKEEEKQMDEAIPDGIEGDEEESEEENNLKFVKFRRWMEDNGCIFPNLILKKYSSNYRGVHVSSPSKDVIPEGSVILHIPHEMLITVELAKVVCQMIFCISICNTTLLCRKVKSGNSLPTAKTPLVLKASLLFIYCRKGTKQRSQNGNASFKNSINVPFPE